MADGLFHNDLIRFALKGLDAVALRQKIIAHNMANINTPGFKRSQVRFEDKLASVLERKGTDNLNDSDFQMLKPEVVKVEGTAQRQDGNNVNLAVELSEMQVNLLLYQTWTQQINDRLSNLGYVINEGRR